VGFGDVGPQNEAERFVTIFLMYVGVIVFGLLLSGIGYRKHASCGKRTHL